MGSTDVKLTLSETSKQSRGGTDPQQCFAPAREHTGRRRPPKMSRLEIKAVKSGQMDEQAGQAALSCGPAKTKWLLTLASVKKHPRLNWQTAVTVLEKRAGRDGLTSLSDTSLSFRS